MFVGEPGIGKSTLLAEARRRAEGLRVLSAHGVESEHELAFGGLIELLAPLADLLPRLPAPQRNALATALALEHGAPPDRFAVGAAVLGLIGVAAEDRGGLLITVDDAGWLDPPSLEAILFATRRLEADGAAVLIAARPSPPLDLSGERLERIDLGGLESAAAAELLSESAGRELAAGPRDQLLAASAGNPLALIEAPHTLSEDQLAGRVALPQPLRPSAAIERSFQSRLDALPEAVRAALVVAAAGEDIELATLGAALADLGLEVEGMDAAEAAEILVVEAGQVRFSHPVLRAVAYHRGTAAERQAAHEAIARALPQADVGRRAWHLAEAAAGPDETVAAALLEAAAEARERGALASAGALVARAAELSPDPGARVQRVLDATTDMIRSGQLEGARSLAESAERLTDDRVLRAELKQVRALLLVRFGRLALGHDLLLEAAEELAPTRPAAAANALLEATLSSRVVGDYDELAALAERARRLALGADPPDPRHAEIAAVQLDLVEVARGGGDRAAAGIESHEALLLAGGPRLAVELNVGPVHAAVWAERYAWAERILARLIDTARGRSAVTEMVYPLCVSAQLELRRGRFALARANADEAVRWATETRQQMMVALGLGALADIEAALGRAEDCRGHVERLVAVCDATGVDGTGVSARALGLLALVEGDPEAALEPLERCERRDLARGVREPRILQVAANLIEARAWAGDRAEAAATLERLELAEREIGGAWTRGAAARGRGLLGDDADLDRHFGDSVQAFEAGHAGYEAARSLLLWGERLRRARRRADSREPLRRALAAFERLGVTALATRARGELEATGEVAAGAAPELRGELTPQELRIGLRVAEGRTNPEVAAELFISRKTVERHLSQIYRKLGVRSRTELARVLAPILPGHPSSPELAVAGDPAAR